MNTLTLKRGAVRIARSMLTRLLGPRHVQRLATAITEKKRAAAEEPPVEHYVAESQRVEHMLHRLDAKMAERFAVSGARSDQRLQLLQSQLEQMGQQMAGLSVQVAALERAMSALANQGLRITTIESLLRRIEQT